MKQHIVIYTVVCSIVFPCLFSISVSGQNQKTTDSFDRVLRATKEDTTKVRLLNSIGYNLINVDNDKTLSYSNEAINLAAKLNFKKGLADAYSNLGSVYYKLGSYDKALANSFKSLLLDEEINNQRGIAEAYTGIGNVYLDKGLYDSALIYQFKSLKIYEQLSFKAGIAINFSDIGLIYETKADYKTALDYYMKNLRLEEETGNKKGTAQANTNLGNIYFAQGSYDKAIEYHTKAKELSEISGDKEDLSYSWNNLGNAHVQKGDYEEGLTCYSAALTILEKLGDKKGIISCVDNMGAVYFFQKKYDEAIPYFLQSKSISEASGNKLGVSSALINIGEVYLNLKQYPKSIDNYKQGIAVARQIGAKDRERDGYKGLSDAYTASGDFKNGYANYKNYSEVKDSILNEVNSKSINDLQIKYEAEKKDKENALLKKDKLIASANIAKQKNEKLIIVISGCSVFIVGLLLFYSWRRKKNYQFRQEITEVKQEALNAQMSDHFIGNAMDSINNFMENNDKEKASEYLLLFNRLIRKVLENSFKRFIPLKDELEVLKIYIELEKLRFAEGTLTYEIRVDDNIDREYTLIPPMIFQVLTENALKHGFKKDTGGGITLTVEKKDNLVNCTVEDNGMGRSASMEAKQGRANTRVSFGSSLAEKLIKTSSGPEEKSSFTIIDLFDGNNKPAGTRVAFTLPLILAA
jgi:tetratricopeptide (TPR) repeat protein